LKMWTSRKTRVGVLVLVSVACALTSGLSLLRRGGRPNSYATHNTDPSLESANARLERLRQEFERKNSAESAPCSSDAGTVRVLRDPAHTKQWCDCNCKGECKRY
jgi:hypothetical protein